MQKSSFFLLCSCVIFALSCSSTRNTATSQNQQPQRPMESYETPVEFTPSVSTVNIPVRLSATQLEKLLNNRLNGTIYDDSNLDDDGLMLKATKSQNITARLEGLQMTYRVPLKLWVFKKVFGSRGIEAEGEVALSFKTTLDIKPDWSVEPRTEMTGYEWIKNMAVKTGLGSIDVKYIANNIISRSKETLTKGIDEQVKKQLQIRKNLEDAWQTMQKPVSIPSSYGTWWVKLTPLSILMSPLRANGDVLESVISAQSLAEVMAGEQQPQFRANTYLPQFQLGNAMTDDFSVHLTTDISMREAEAMAKTFALNQTFTPNGKKITVTNIQLFGQNDKIVVNTSFSGSYTGSLYLIGRPVFNAEKNTIEMEDLDYDLNTRNFLLRSANWLFDKTILKKIKESCVFKLDDNVTFFKTMTNDKLRDYKFNNNVSLRGQVDDIKVERISLLQGNIKIYVAANGKLNLDVNGLDSF